jgi:DNA-directed RNA polymerase subunit RPC12/RpoP
VCGSRRIRVKRVTVQLPNRPKRTVRAEVCLACGEQFFTREVAAEILAARR